MCLNAGAMGRQDAESETLIPTFGGGFDDAYSIRTANTSSNGWGVQHEVTHTLDQAQGLAVAHTLRGDGFDASEDGTGRGTPLVPVAYRVHGEHSTAMTGNGSANVADPVDTARSLDTCGGYATNQGGNVVLAPAIAFGCKDSDPSAALGEEVAPTLRAMGHTDSHANAGGKVAVAFVQNQRDEVRTMEVAGALAAEPGAKQQTYLQTAMAVRRLTPRECERLQGAEDDWTLVPNAKGKPMADGPRYKMLGNSFAVPVIRWIGQQIERASQQLDQEQAA